MTKTFNKIKVGIGLAALATLFAFNLHHAVVYHYGVLNLNYSQNWQIYAQTNSAGGTCQCGGFSNGNRMHDCEYWCLGPPPCTGGGGDSHPGGGISGPNFIDCFDSGAITPNPNGIDFPICAGCTGISRGFINPRARKISCQRR